MRAALLEPRPVSVNPRGKAGLMAGRRKRATIYGAKTARSGSSPRKRCMRTLPVYTAMRVRIQRAQKTQTKGAVGYEGVSETPQTVLGAKAAWPASLLFGGRGQQGANLPTSEIDAGDIALLPVSVPIIIQPADGLIDDLGRHYRVRAAEKTEMGWRLQVYEAHP